MFSVSRETAFFLLLQKQHLVAKNEFEFSFRPMRKDQQVGGQYANVSHRQRVNQLQGNAKICASH